MTQDKNNTQCLESSFELIDSHCHLDFPIFDSTRTLLLEQCAENNIHKFIVPGVTKNTWTRLQKTSQEFPSIYPAYGMHPYFLNEHQLSHVENLAELVKSTPVIAIGEIGLDYYLTNLDKKRQQVLFVAQLDVALENHLPVILHVRKAHDDVLFQLRRKKLVGGAVHAFNGSYQQAKQYIDLGFKLGLGGALTFDRATRLKNLAAQLPLDAILLETDSPDMMPSPLCLNLSLNSNLENKARDYNTPLTLLCVLKILTEIRRESSAEIAFQVAKNTYEVFPRLKIW